jgi:twitching motility protein PilT
VREGLPVAASANEWQGGDFLKAPADSLGARAGALALRGAGGPRPVAPAATGKPPGERGPAHPPWLPRKGLRARHAPAFLLAAPARSGNDTRTASPRTARQAPTMAMIDELFDIMLSKDASDLHLAQDSLPRIRLHGRVVELTGQPVLEEERIRTMLSEICSPQRWERFEETGDLDFAYALGTKARFRCNYNKQASGYGAVFRTIPSRIKTLEELKVPAVLKTFADYRAGMVLVTGPTGSGKSTTLAGVINEINENASRHILTIEEPIEFVHPMKNSVIVQREVGVDSPSFSSALRSASRQDADVILVGEMRDLETIALAVTAAEMGVLVFGTLHTNSAPKTVDRIIDVFPSDQQNLIRQSLATSLKAVCAQLLLKKKGGGRIAANEIMIQTRAISNYIREGKTNQLAGVIMSSKALGMQLMDDCIDALLKNNIIEGEEAYMKAIDKDRFRQFEPK